MIEPLTGVRVVEMGEGIAARVTGLLLGEAGADVVRVDVIGHVDASAEHPGVAVWGRKTRRVEVDPDDESGRQRLTEVLDGIDVLVLGIEHPHRMLLSMIDELTARNESLIHCTLTGHPPGTSHAAAVGYDALVQARLGLGFEQPGLEEGPTFLQLPLPSMFAALEAAAGISAALLVRARTGCGQRVEATLLQGALAFTNIPWVRVERPPDQFDAFYRCRTAGYTPCYPAADRWVHPMPEATVAVLEALGLDQGDLPGRPSGECEEVHVHQDALAELYRRRTASEWIEYLGERDLRCQLVQSVEEALEHPHFIDAGIVQIVDVPGVGSTRQFAQPYRISAPNPDTAAPSRMGNGRAHDGPGSAPLEGLCVLDFGIALAGPYAASILADLGADVVRVENIVAPRSSANQTWAACQRGKRSIVLDLKSDDGQCIVQRMATRADVIVHNMRPGVAERLHIDYESLRQRNPGLVYCHLTGFGSEGPLADAKGCDQMAQALTGLEHDQGATGAGGHPTWYRFGMCDHAGSLLSVIGIVQALVRRSATGVGALVETDLLRAAGLLSTDTYLPDGEQQANRLRLDPQQRGFSALHRFYATADGWLCLAALIDEEWRALSAALGNSLTDDGRFTTAEGRKSHDASLTRLLADTFVTRPAAEWVADLVPRGVPCDVVSERFAHDWYDDPQLRAVGMVADYPHRAWGRVQQYGRLVALSATPLRIERGPVEPGADTREILTELGYDRVMIDDLCSRRVVAAGRGVQS